ncbi:hypothetical protein AB0A74_01030 [Saccharothrix sp. NPDC042600]|uniref:DUF7507 domain-containing protein n=1 Tax=Saccharothrix TaxID=2071 RepID=UPI0033E7F0EA|nr:hypothetical protein GCM10017745_49100 [Saccharothrix mutabilis subsp. capreolus]
MASATVPGTPGVPQAAALLVAEDFENAATPTPRLLSTYVGASGQTYTADTPYLTNCNGNVVEFDSTDIAASNCNGNDGAFSGIRQMAHALGTFAGDSTPNDNHVVSGWTLAAIPAGQTRVLELTPQISLAAANRFIIASVDVVALTCTAPPVYTFAVTSGTTSTTLGSSLNVCGTGVDNTVISVPAVGSAPARDMRAATLTSDTAALVTGNTAGLVMRNLTTAAGGNDGSFDNVRILDATPQLDKSFSAPVGGTSTLTLTVTNTSELAAKPGWSFDDDLPAGMTVVGTPTTTCPNGVASVSSDGGTLSVTGDLDTGMESCTVTASVQVTDPGTYTNGPSNITTSAGLNPPADATVAFAASMTLEKSASPTAVTAAGDQVTYSFVLTNTGDVEITNPTVTETAFTGSGGSPTVTCPAEADPLSVGEEVTCTATYTVTQADLGRATIDNTATAAGTAGATSVTTEPSSASVTMPQTPSLSLVKTADPATVSAAGQSITYSFVVTNTGNAALSDIAVADQLTAPAGPAVTVACPSTTLAPNASVTCTATYTATQADVDHGSVDNTATATGTAPDGTTATSPSSSASVSIPPDPSLTVVKSADPATADTVGQTITFNFVVTNTGNVTLTGISVDDTLSAPAGPEVTVTCPSTGLAPGESTTCTSSPYTVTQADADHGSVDNSAIATGTAPDGTGVQSEPSTTSAAVDVAPEPAPAGPPTMPDTGPSVINPAVGAALALVLGIGTRLVATYRRKRL